MDQYDQRRAALSRSHGMNAGAGLLRQNLCHVELICSQRVI
jgi:hypothetical protein